MKAWERAIHRFLTGMKGNDEVQAWLNRFLHEACVEICRTNPEGWEHFKDTIEKRAKDNSWK